MIFSFLKIAGIIAIFQMVLLILFFNSRKNRNTSNKILSLILFVYTIQICAIDFLTSVTVNILVKFNLFPAFCNQFMLLFGPLIWIYSKTIIEERINRWQLLHTIPFLIMILYILIKNRIDPNYLFLSTEFSFYTSGLILGQCLIYILLTGVSVYRKIDLYKIHFKQSDEAQRLYGFLLAGFILLWALKFNTFLLINVWKVFGICPYAASSYFIAGFLFLNILVYIAFIKPELFARKRKYQNNNLTAENRQQILKELLKTIEVEKIYSDSALTLTLLAKKMGISVHCLSQIINEEFQLSFPEFINGYRVKEARQLLLNNRSGCTVQQIMYEVGFSSRSAFNIAFKKYTGFTPSELRQKQ